MALDDRVRDCADPGGVAVAGRDGVSFGIRHVLGSGRDPAAGIALCRGRIRRICGCAAIYDTERERRSGCGRAGKETVSLHFQTSARRASRRAEVICAGYPHGAKPVHEVRLPVAMRPTSPKRSRSSSCRSPPRASDYSPNYNYATAHGHREPHGAAESTVDIGAMRKCAAVQCTAPSGQLSRTRGVRA